MTELFKNEYIIREAKGGTRAPCGPPPLLDPPLLYFPALKMALDVDSA